MAGDKGMCRHKITRKGRSIMDRGKLAACGFLILALVLSSQVGSHLVVMAAANQAESSGLMQSAGEGLAYSVSASSTGTHYYVDSISGSDSNVGTSEDKPWRTLAPVHARSFLPGDVVHFRRGSSWTGGLVIDDSGVEGNPITFTTYGTWDRPVIRNPGGTYNRTNAVVIYADWVVVEGLLLQDAHDSGVCIRRGSDNNVVRDIEATNVGMGVEISGQYNLVTLDYPHDL